jgi:hypothetical protein
VDASEGVIRGCEFSVRAKEYALRGWYPQAIDKARVAHLLDFNATSYAQQVADYARALVTFLNNNTFDRVSTLFPELDLKNGNDQIAEVKERIRERDLAETFDEFQPLVNTLVQSPTWAARVLTAQQQINTIEGAQLDRFRLFMDFNLSDLKVAGDYGLKGQSPNLDCAVLFPTQFTYSSKASGALVEAANGFPAVTGCRIEAYRAILIQAFTVSGGNLVDSEFHPIPMVQTPTTTESLDDPTPVLASRITDAKLIRSIVDAVFNDQRAQGLNDLPTADADRLVAAINGLQLQLSTALDKRIDFYRTAATYASTKNGLVYLRLGARFADELKTLEGRKL